MEFDLKNGLQRHAYRLLDDLLPQTGNSDGAGLSASAFRDLHPPHRRRAGRCPTSRISRSARRLPSKSCS